jgi:uncharacterized protein (DUF302 family)
MFKMADYAFIRSIGMSVAEAEQRVREELDKEGFGVLTRIDIAEKMREKLNVEFDEYVILGACNPPNAFKALKAEINIGLMLPCNVCVYSNNGQTFVSAIKPSVAMGMIENAQLAETAGGIEQKLQRVIENV